MAATKKIISFDENGVFEAREISLAKPQVFPLTRLEELKALSFISEAGLLSKAEDAGIFSKLESAGAFSTIEGLLPTIDKLGLLTLLEDALEVEAGLQFTAANFLIVFGPVLLTLQICGFVPLPSEPVSTTLEVLVCLSTLTVGAALFALAFGVSLLQGDKN
eukprot:CAMPEP_0119326176 /NCGR_PEP_ID=MMETSP1333-20130426/67724_1 /TAXON_ID=418940 /ORGANISM="Scyphosphaera apsteinii, Strain RCC1455" /LENGTH=161 /DNA_ID=CAMNT_0007334405 /DNA_START=120 /DNA_END=605 /DNA_ORIENTATION=-